MLQWVSFSQSMTLTRNLHQTKWTETESDPEVAEVPYGDLLMLVGLQGLSHHSALRYLSLLECVTDGLPHQAIAPPVVPRPTGARPPKKQLPQCSTDLDARRSYNNNRLRWP